ncbi:MAG TPA: TonB family protein [Steroidobacteraceae bacterium]|nr:TonB family protein [Steroidobacteraceae bacterium]
MTRSRPNATVDTSAVPGAPARAPAAPSPVVRVHPDVAVVTTDAELAAALRAAAPDVFIMTVEAPGALPDLLLSGTYGVLVMDVPALGADPATILNHLAAQFPDLPIVAVGTREEEALVAALISAGQVYRYLHRPMSPERARTFLEAALRRHADRIPLLHAPSSLPAPPSALTSSRLKARRPAPRYAAIGTQLAHRLPRILLGAAAALAVLALFLALRPHGSAPPHTPRAAVRGVLRTVTPAPVPEPAPEPAQEPAQEPVPVVTIAPVVTVAPVAPVAPHADAPGATAAPHARRQAAESFAEPAAVAPPAPDSVLPAAPVDVPLPGAPPEIGPLPDSNGPLPAVSAPASDASPPAVDAGAPAMAASPLAAEVAAAPPAQIAPLVKVLNVPPAYPLEARLRGTEGWVDVHFTVSPQGVTDNVRVTNASPRGVFDQAALDAVSRWRYAPRPSAAEVDERVRFRF